MERVLSFMTLYYFRVFSSRIEGMELSRPQKQLIEIARKYPSAWRLVDQMRSQRGISLPDWPSWCFLPMAGTYSAVTAQHGIPRIGPAHLDLIGDVSALSALAAWRVTQGIYRFDETLYAEVVETSLAGDLPCEVFQRLPEWCVYIETPGLSAGTDIIYGAFAYLEWDVAEQRIELRLLFDTDSGLVPFPIHLGPWSLSEAVERFIEEAGRRANEVNVHARVPVKAFQGYVMAAESVMALLLYLCSVNGEIGDGARRPFIPQPVKTKKGMRLFVPEREMVWDVGLRLGAALQT
ncbi:MAG: hypothetical protein WC291_06125, partial [Thermodesulfovibrionales bacterium]